MSSETLEKLRQRRRFLTQQRTGGGGEMLCPKRLLLLQFAWIIPYIFLANYLERSLLPLRLACYTQPDLLSAERYAPTRPACLRKLFQGVRSIEKERCTLKDDESIHTRPRVPDGPPPEAVMVVRSTPGARDYRSYIRRTWKPQVEKTTPVYFVVGLGAIDTSEEAAEFGDLLVLNFTDSYFGLSRKMTVTYGWFLDAYPRETTRLVVVNDDVVVNARALEQLDLPSPSVPWMAGKVSRGYPRIVFPWLTWFVSNAQYPNVCYPRFTQGSSFILSRPAVALIHERACAVPQMTLDDVWMGVLALCLPFEQLHREGFDVHWPRDFFVVFHYQYARYSAAHLESLYHAAQLQ